MELVPPGAIMHGVLGIFLLTSSVVPNLFVHTYPQAKKKCNPRREGLKQYERKEVVLRAKLSKKIKLANHCNHMLSVPFYLKSIYKRLVIVIIRLLFGY